MPFCTCKSYPVVSHVINAYSVRHILELRKPAVRIYNCVFYKSGHRGQLIGTRVLKSTCYREVSSRGISLFSPLDTIPLPILKSPMKDGCYIQGVLSKQRILNRPMSGRLYPYS